MAIRNFSQGEGGLKNLVIGLMSAFSIPISIYPGWYKRARERHAYRPFFQPWRIDDKFQREWEELSSASTSRVRTAHNIYTFAKMVDRLEGEIWECGVYRGATSRLISVAATDSSQPQRKIRLFDTFEGMPEQTEEYDDIPVGELSNTSLDEVRNRVGAGDNVSYHPGFVPDTFAGLEESRLALVHIDLDQYQSIHACLDFVYPRMVAGGIILFDDYGKPGTYGSRLAADEFFADRPETLLVLETGQAVAIVYK